MNTSSPLGGESSEYSGDPFAPVSDLRLGCFDDYLDDRRGLPSRSIQRSDPFGADVTVPGRVALPRQTWNGRALW